MSLKADFAQISLSAAEIMIAKTKDAVRQAFFPVGNAPKFEFSTMGQEIVTVKDFTRAGCPPLGDVMKSSIPEFSIQLQEPRARNLEHFFMSDDGGYTQEATAVTDEQLDGPVYVGAVYKLANCLIAESPALVLESTDTVPIAFTLDTHYTLDRQLGLIEIIALPGTAVAGETMLQSSYTPTAIAAADATMKLDAGSLFGVEGGLIAIGQPSKGPKLCVQIWRAQIAPDGAFPFVTEDPLGFGLKIKVLSDTAHPEGLFRVFEVPEFPEV